MRQCVAARPAAAHPSVVHLDDLDLGLSDPQLGVRDAPADIERIQGCAGSLQSEATHIRWQPARRDVSCLGHDVRPVDPAPPLGWS
jgi:hypothetical protein